MQLTRRRWLRAGLVGSLLLIVAVGGVAAYVWRQLSGSLPVTSGVHDLDGLAAPVTIARDRLGIPLITAASREDAARALGFVHAQERFFQMDLQRRQPAGELAALFGARAVEADRMARVHRFRTIAEEAVARMAPDYRRELEAYTAGVNAGLEALARPPFEYLLIGRIPERWRPADSVLTVLAMFGTLQGRQALFERTLGDVAEALPAPLAAFLSAVGSDWNAPVEGTLPSRPPVPGPDIVDLRREPAALSSARHRPPVYAAPRAVDPLDDLAADAAAALGSNSWVVAGRHTESGVPLVANDMHLGLNVPNIWFRAAMVVPDAERSDAPLRSVGLTLPGLPPIVAGSNGHIAWGFTNSGGDWSDLVVVERDARDPAKYVTAEGPRAFETFTETIAVAGSEPIAAPVTWTMWGPVIATGRDGRPLVQRWVAHDAALLASDLSLPQRSHSVAEALPRFATLGMPEQNVVVADREGHIGWTIAGRIPRRRGHDGRLPASWADGTRGWDGYLEPDEHPRIFDPPSGRIWTANAPVVGGEGLRAIGEGGYAEGVRARMIRDRLQGIDRATPFDFLTYQRDDAARFHERWRELWLRTLDPSALVDHPARREFRELIDGTWTGRASPESVGYRLVRTARLALHRQVFDAITAPVAARHPDFDYARTMRSEGPLWTLVSERPVHLLNPHYRTWDDQLLAAIDEAIDELTANGEPLPRAVWGEVTRAEIRHPLSTALPWLGRWLNMPNEPLPGDTYTPLAQSARTGPSERIVVSPGREDEGLGHMPGGQSGHPLSPHYRDQHGAWATGQPLPLLPGAAVETLTLRPRQAR